MKIGILSRKPDIYSTSRIREEGEKRGHNVSIIDLNLISRQGYFTTFSIRILNNPVISPGISPPIASHSLPDIPWQYGTAPPSPEPAVPLQPASD